jgi:hypothetical protein
MVGGGPHHWHSAAGAQAFSYQPSAISQELKAES